MKVVLKRLTFLFFVMLLGLSACKTREPVTAETFMETMQKLDYAAKDTSAQYEGYEQIKKAVFYESDSLYMDFYEFTDEETTQSFFDWNKTQSESFKDDTSSESAFNMGNYHRYTLKTSGKYYYLASVANTAVYGYCDKSMIDTFNEIIKAIGY